MPPADRLHVPGTASPIGKLLLSVMDLPGKGGGAWLRLRRQVEIPEGAWPVKLKAWIFKLRKRGLEGGGALWERGGEEEEEEVRALRLPLCLELEKRLV